MGIEFTYCPDCGKKGVNLRTRFGDGDLSFYGCRYCSFNYQPPPSSGPLNDEEFERWLRKNSDQVAHYTCI